MSMSQCYYAISDNEIDIFKAQPLKLDILFYGELDEDYLKGLPAEVAADLTGWQPAALQENHNLEGAFMGLHCFLSGETEANTGSFPLNFIATHRLPVGEIGWGPVNFFYAADVAVLAQALNALDDEILIKRYNADFYNQHTIYPKGYHWKPEDGAFLLAQLNDLSAFINQLAAAGKGMFSVIR